MGLVRLCKGDLFSGHPEAIAHGCNLKGAMGAGVAIHFKEHFPEMYEQYHEACKNEKLKLGDIFVYNGEMNGQRVRVYNLMTQEGFDGAELKALHESINAMCIDADNEGIKTITMPLIGSGFGYVTPTTCLNFVLAAAAKYKVNLDVIVQVIDDSDPEPILEKRRKIDPDRPIPIKQ